MWLTIVDEWSVVTTCSPNVIWAVNEKVIDGLAFFLEFRNFSFWVSRIAYIGQFGHSYIWRVPVERSSRDFELFNVTGDLNGKIFQNLHFKDVTLHFFLFSILVESYTSWGLQDFHKYTKNNNLFPVNLKKLIYFHIYVHIFVFQLYVNPFPIYRLSWYKEYDMNIKRFKLFCNIFVVVLLCFLICFWMKRFLIWIHTSSDEEGGEYNRKL